MPTYYMKLCDIGTRVRIVTIPLATYVRIYLYVGSTYSEENILKFREHSYLIRPTWTC